MRAGRPGLSASSIRAPCTRPCGALVCAASLINSRRRLCVSQMRGVKGEGQVIQPPYELRLTLTVLGGRNELLGGCGSAGRRRECRWRGTPSHRCRLTTTGSRSHPRSTLRRRRYPFYYRDGWTRHTNLLRMAKLINALADQRSGERRPLRALDTLQTPPDAQKPD
jgi:hypothetical protein